MHLIRDKGHKSHNLRWKKMYQLLNQKNKLKAQLDYQLARDRSIRENIRPPPMDDHVDLTMVC